MTETKRFEIKKEFMYEGFLKRIYDNSTGKVYDCTFINQDVLCDLLNQLNDENEQLKQRNKRQYNQLIELWSLIENKDWETLTNMVKQMEEDEEQLQKEWRCYE